MTLKKLFAIGKKDALVRFSNPSELLFFLILPILFTFTLGGGFGGDTPGADAANPPLLLVQQEEGAFAADLIAAIEAADLVTLERHDRAEAERLFDEDEAAALLIIPEDFNERLLAGEEVALTFQSNPNDPNAVLLQQVVGGAAGQLSRIVDTAVLSVREAEERAPFASDAERQAYFEQSIAEARDKFLSLSSTVEVTVPDSTVGEFEAYSTAAHQSAGQLVTWVLIPLLATSSLLASERTQGTLRRLLTLPVSNMTYIVGTILGQLAIASIQMALLIGFGTLVMGLNWGRSPLGLVVMMGSFGLAAVALGTAIGAFTKNEIQAGNLSIMLGMVFALLGGCWWPLELFPAFLQQAVRILPTTWAMQGFTDLVIRGLGVQAVMPEALVLFGFATLFLVIGVTRFRYE